MAMSERAVGGRWVDVLVGLFLFALCLVVYGLTLTPSLSFKSPDGNELATVAYQLGLAHSTGYPLYTWLGKLFTLIPLGDVAHRVNLMSATLAAGTVALLYGTLLVLTRRRLPSLFAALFFGFSLTFWSQAEIAEVYAPNAFMVALTLLLLVLWTHQEDAERNSGTQKWISLSLALFLAFCLVFGLSLGTHMSNLGFIPAFVIFVLLVNWRIVLQPLKLLGGVFSFLAGCAQFLWLPYKASTLVDAPMARNAPDTLAGFYKYTLGAFPQMKFAFPLWAMPDRVVVYLHLLWQNFGVLGILLGLLGMWEMLLRRTRHFYLLITMYVVHLVFFTQYRVFDLDVFFIPAHLVYAVFIGYGLYRLLEYLSTALGRVRVPRLAVSLAAALLLLLSLCQQLQANWPVNDLSGDVAINDFYYNVFQLLPEGSALVGQGGVFGYDMFYFRYVYGVRPDVAMPMAEPLQARTAGVLRDVSPVYSTVPVTAGRQLAGPWAPPAGLLGEKTWAVPLLVGETPDSSFSQLRGSLVLYEMRGQPPQLVVSDADPAHELGVRLNGLELVGYDLDGSLVEQGGRLHLTLYWRIVEGNTGLVVTAIGDNLVEQHALGFGNLKRYADEFQTPADSVVVEDYWLVVPSSTAPGEAVLQVGTTSAWPGGETELIALTTVEVKAGGYFSSPFYGGGWQRG
jgi:hypothetical protein